jgi:dTDP-4-dehydrorhamnose 3,5-epimerase-like enzyme
MLGHYKMYKFIDIKNFLDSRGQLSVLEFNEVVSFQAKRIYYLKKVGKGEERGLHGHIALEQIFIPIAGSFDIHIDDGRECADFTLKEDSKALYLSQGYWRKVHNFSENAVCIVLASERYDPDDYIHDYGEFLTKKGLCSNGD